MQLLLFRYGDNNVFSRICALYSQALSSIKVEDMTPRFGQLSFEEGYTEQKKLNPHLTFEEWSANQRGIRFGRPSGRRNITVRPIPPKYRAPLKDRPNLVYPTKIVDPGPWYYKPVHQDDRPENLKMGVFRFVNERLVSRRHEQIQLPNFCPGSIIRVRHQQNVLSDKEVTFIGICLGIRRKGISTSFTLRNIIGGVSVEKTFPLYAPTTKSIEVLKYERRNRMKLNYLRERPDSETIIQDLPDIKNMTQEEMDAHNRLCDLIEYKRQENINKNMIFHLQNLLRKKYEKIQEEALRNANPPPPVRQFGRRQLSRIRKLVRLRRKKEQRAFNRMKKLRRPQRFDRKLLRLAKEFKRNELQARAASKKQNHLILY